MVITRESRKHMEHLLPKGPKNPLFCRNSKDYYRSAEIPWEYVLVMRYKTTTRTLEGVEKSCAKTITLANSLNILSH